MGIDWVNMNISILTKTMRDIIRNLAHNTLAKALERIDSRYWEKRRRTKHLEVMRIRDSQREVKLMDTTS